MEMTSEFDKRLKNVEMTSRFEKWPKYFGSGLDAWFTAKAFEKRLYYVGSGLRI